MGRLVYSAITSLDLYVEDAAGEFGWAAPDEQVMEVVNDLERPIGTYLYGRRMYETMRYWETVEDDPSPADRDFIEIWRAADKVVFSRTLEAVDTARTRLESNFDPDAVRDLVQRSHTDVSIGGAELAAQALAAGLVDDIHLLFCPIVVGGGKRALPDGVHSRLELRSHRSFDAGVVHLHYAVGAG
jgi:dihydrofolate reductase